ncbi:MAG: tyrosine-type recombinase/integrase [Planctomycetes bacterium]|nr:tyrosine-type recombinase/integrase [Planctomycetota bacterium]
MAGPVPTFLLPQLEAWIASQWRHTTQRTRRRGLFIGLCYHGLRSVEVIRMRADQFCPLGPSLYFKSAKRGRYRTVQLEPEFARVLHGFHTRYWPDHVLLFPSERGTPIDRKQYFLYGLAMRRVIGGKFSLHSLRHNSALRVWYATRDLLAVQSHLGHKSVAMTANYLHRIMPLPPETLPSWPNVSPRFHPHLQLRKFAP